MTDEVNGDTLLADLAGQSLHRVPTLADDLVDQLWGEAYDPAGPVPKDDLWRSCHDNLTNMLKALGGSGPGPGELLESARATGTRRARQHCPLDWVLHAWHSGGEIMWHDLADRTGNRDPADLQLLVRCASDVWGVTDRFSIEMAAAYQHVEQHLLGTTDYHLADVIDALLDGQAGHVDGDAARALRLGSSGRYLIAVAEDTARYHSTARELTGTLGRHGLPSTWHLRAGVHVGIIPAEETTPEHVAILLRLPAAARIGLSPVLTDLRQAPSGYRMAMLAMSTLPAGQAAATTLDQCLPDALLLSSPDLSQRLVANTFGPILQLPAQERDELFRTVHAWIDSLGSSLRAAKSLHCHRNTVLNRLNRFRSLTGLDLGDVGVWPQVMLALSALRQGNRY